MRKHISRKKAIVISLAAILLSLLSIHIICRFSETAIKNAAFSWSVFKGSSSFYSTPSDIRSLMEEAQANGQNDKKDGDIKEFTYGSDGATDKYERVIVRNTNKAEINIKEILSQKSDLSVNKSEPSVLIFHSHTTESYQLLDRSFYAVGFIPRSNDENRNMVRVGEEICREIEKAGYKVIHDKKIHDYVYSSAYDDSRKSVIEYLKKYNSIKVILDIHRDAIQTDDGTKIKPVTTLMGRKAAQLMIITGCGEEGSGVENFPHWRQNLIFACELQDVLEEKFPTITRPVFFCPRRYNMNLSHTSLLVEVGSDANTLDEACFSGRCLGAAVSEILSRYEEKND